MAKHLLQKWAKVTPVYGTSVFFAVDIVAQNRCYRLRLSDSDTPLLTGVQRWRAIMVSNVRKALLQEASEN